MVLEQKLHLKLAQRLVMTPTLQQAIKLLQMSKLELQEILNQELVENPVLEEEAVADAAPEKPQAEAAAPEAGPQEKERDSFDEIDFDAFFQDYIETGYNPRQHEDREEISIENTLAQTPDLHEHLTWQLSMTQAPARVREIVEYLIGNVDEDGYLRLSRSEIEAAGSYEEEDVDKALALVRSFDPAGVGAFDLPECLMLQMRALGIENPLIEDIITHHWLEFLNRQFASLAKSLGVPLAELQAAAEIVKNLEPKPGRRYSSDRTIYVEPDVIVRKVGDEYLIQLNEDGLPRLRLSSTYRRMLRGSDGVLPGDARSYIKDKMRSAIWLIKSLDQRQRTIYKVAESIVRHQRDFLDRGIEYLRPLVLRDVANDIGMHESTVSRVVSNKYMHTPRGLFPMKYFFHSGIDCSDGSDVSSLSIKNKIGKMIEEEDTQHPLSDAKIMEKLRAEGIQIARRTVAKYREELRIPSSNQRKTIF